MYMYHVMYMYHGTCICTYTCVHVHIHMYIYHYVHIHTGESDTYTCMYHAIYCKSIYIYFFSIIYCKSIYIYAIYWKSILKNILKKSILHDTYMYMYLIRPQQQCIMQYTWINIHIHLCMYIMYILALESQIKAQS